MPVVLGEVDIIKSLLFLPGVTNAGEGQSGSFILVTEKRKNIFLS
jgi:hypothetical protein